MYSAQPPFSSIEWRFDQTDATLRNNLVSHNLRDRMQGATADSAGDLADTPADWWADATNHDLHLADGSPAIGAGVAIDAGAADTDVDGEARDLAAPDVGADEWAAKR